MTTFTTEDRIMAEKDGSLTFNVEPIPFAGWVTTSPPHIVDSGASVMIKDLTDDEIREVCTQSLAPKDGNIFTFARAILRKAQEK
jgi:hypothetical protein